MIGYALFLAGRLVVVAFALVTWAYCVSTYSPFAFDMFIRPQLFPWLETFVDWHHAWYFGAYLISLATLAPDLAGRRAHEHRAARIAAIAYAAVFFAIGIMLVGSPYLRLLSTTTRGPMTAYIALVPLVWLAVVDLLATRRELNAATLGRPPTSQHRLLAAALSAALIAWVTHFARALLNDASIRDGGAWLAAGAWSLALDLTAFATLFALLGLILAFARTRANPADWEYHLGVVLLALGLEEFFRRLVFPSLAFAPGDGAAIATGFGAALAFTWSGVRMRRAAGASEALETASLLPPHASRRWIAVVLAIVTPLAALAAIDRVEHLDWDFLIQKAITLAEGLMLFGLALRIVPESHRPVSLRWTIAAPLAALAFLAAVPMLLRAGPDRLRPDVLRDRYAVLDPAFRLTADAFIEQRARDTEFATALRRYAERSLEPLPSLPAVDYVPQPGPAIEPLPHIFFFVIDGLRRDYLSPYNPAVTFTPSFGGWARDALVFENAFTRYGGTWLAMPSIWSGAPARRAWTRDGFARINSLERLITSHRYRLAINDFTVAGHLKGDTAHTFLDPGVKSVNTDICSNVTGIEQLLSADRSPLFSFVAPMNVYVLNTAVSDVVDEAGFNAAYAANVSRVDRCFGEFVTFLKRAGLYDNSVIAVTSDHGESLGEDGNWGHQFWLFPEDVRIPLIVSLPPRLRAGLTTDLGRVSFSSDLVATFYRVLGHDVRDLGDLFGLPLVSPVGTEPPSRRRQSFLLMSSYGASYGMLRRNGKFLYISDLINYREYAFELFRQPIGARVRVTDDLRRVNQGLIRAHVADIDRFYGRP